MHLSHKGVEVLTLEVKPLGPLNRNNLKSLRASLWGLPTAKPWYLSTTTHKHQSHELT